VKSLAIRDHTVLSLPPDITERDPPNPSHTVWNSIYLPRGMELSWPMWLTTWSATLVNSDG